MGLPVAIKLAKTDEARQLIEVGIHGDSEVVRAYTMPPKTPKERVQMLRKDFLETLKDKEFLVEKAKLGVNPVSGEETGRSTSKASPKGEGLPTPP